MAEFLRIELVAGALLALWVVTRYPRLGPRTMRPAIGIAVCTVVAVRFMPFGVAPLTHVPHGAYLALFGCILPSFFATFLAAGWLLRLCAGTLGGHGGGPDRGIPVSAR